MKSLGENIFLKRKESVQVTIFQSMKVNSHPGHRSRSGTTVDDSTVATILAALITGKPRKVAVEHL